MNSFQFEQISNLTESQQKQYITKYFIPLTNGNHLLLKNGKYEMVSHDIFTRTHLNRLPKAIKDYYTKEFTGIKTPVYQLNKPLFFDDKINLCPQLKESKPFKDFDKNIKAKVQIMLDYIFEVLANKNKAVYDHLLKWLANMMKGNKNDSCVVLKTSFEGVGKSTLPQFIYKHVLGSELALETGSDPLTSRFNSILSGKLFVFFEELETFHAAQWMAVSSVLKRLITSEFTTYESKGENRFEAENINNYFILSNHDVQDEGRRFFVLDVNVEKMHDKEYWRRLYGECFNDDVGYAFYCYLREIDTTDFRPQHFPITTSKTNSINKRLDSVFHFIKESYVLKKKGISCSVSDLFNEYLSYCVSHGMKKQHGKIDFNTKLSSVDIKYYKSNGTHKYKKTYEELEAISKKFNWIHELDEFVEPEGDDDYDDDIIVEQNKQLQKQNKELQDRIKALEEELNKLKSKPIKEESDNQSEANEEDEEEEECDDEEDDEATAQQNLTALKKKLNEIL